MLAKVFDLFTQVDRSLDRSQGGLGIGLTLVRRLVEMHGGSVQARSDGPGHGSEFILRLPMVACEPGTRRATPSGATRGQADGLEVASWSSTTTSTPPESLGRLLRQARATEVSIANDGPTALREFEAIAPEIILLDIGLPGMDGYEVARQIRERARRGKRSCSSP